jgi:hypothetical protein
MILIYGYGSCATLTTERLQITDPSSRQRGNNESTCHTKKIKTISANWGYEVDYFYCMTRSNNSLPDISII